MTYIGRFQAGDSIPLAIVCQGAKYGAHVQPSTVIYAMLYKSDGTVVDSAPMIPKDRYSGNWNFTARYRLGSGFTAGLYSVLYEFLSGSTPYGSFDTFEVVAGGDSDGTVIATESLVGPEATYLLYETESGNIMAGRNPY